MKRKKIELYQLLKYVEYRMEQPNDSRPKIVLKFWISLSVIMTNLCVDQIQFCKKMILLKSVNL